MTAAILIAILLLAPAFGASADNLEVPLRRHIEFISSPSLLGRAAGSAGEREAACYLYDELSKAGVEMLSNREGSTFSVISSAGDTISSCNIVGIIEGSDPVLREEYIVLGAHFDHLGYYSVNVNGTPTPFIYPGADANASGVAALIECARLLVTDAPLLKRSVIIAGFGATEAEFAGSRYFCGEGFGFNDRIKLMVNLDMLGKCSSRNPFEMYTSIPQAEMSGLTDYVNLHESTTIRPSRHSGVIFPSDCLAFTGAEIPSLTFSTGISREYRTVRDTPDLINYTGLEAETLYISSFVKSAAIKDILFVNAGEETEDKVYSFAECDVKPQFFRKGEAYFLTDWVYKYLKYPKSALEAGIQGKVTVSFIINAKGEVTDVTVVNGVSEALDAEAVKVVAASPKWTAGQIGGHKVCTKLVIPVEFRLKKN